jgi:carbamoyltransferase
MLMVCAGLFLRITKTTNEDVPAVVHVNKQSRMQTVSLQQNDLLYEILHEFHMLTGVPCLLNTSFNLRGESIVSSPADAVSTFERSGIDCLVFGRAFLIEKEAQIC